MMPAFFLSSSCARTVSLATISPHSLQASQLQGACGSDLHSQQNAWPSAHRASARRTQHVTPQHEHSGDYPSPRSNSSGYTAAYQSQVFGPWTATSSRSVSEQRRLSVPDMEACACEGGPLPAPSRPRRSTTHSHPAPGQKLRNDAAVLHPPWPSREPLARPTLILVPQRTRSVHKEPTDGRWRPHAGERSLGQRLYSPLSTKALSAACSLLCNRSGEPPRS
jgi:hypothetical protein